MKKASILFMFSILFILGISCLASTSNDKDEKVKVKHELKESGYGKISYYHNKFVGRKTANGEIFSQNKLTTAVPLVRANPDLKWVLRLN